MKQLRVKVQPRPYPIWVGHGIHRRMAKLLKPLGPPSRIHIVSDRRVYGLHGEPIEQALQELGRPVSRTLVPANESAKSVSWWLKIQKDFIRAGADRDSWIVAFGGGVVGDLAAFAASTLFRGIDIVAVPTTLLAMVDASVGGKTAIDLPEGKNLIGTFHQPLAVLTDVEFLSTLAERHRRAGWAEVTKTAAIADERLFRRLEREVDRLQALDPDAVASVILACVRIKAKVVEADVRESGLRAILNFGHTLGHAIEAASGYRGLLHGEAVAVGMVFAALLGEGAGISETGTAERLRRVLRSFRAPCSWRALDTRAVLDAMLRDKKRRSGKLRWVLLPRIGEAIVTHDVSLDDVRRLLRKPGG